MDAMRVKTAVIKEATSFNEDIDLRKELNSIYTPLSVAKKEIWRRWNDKELRKRVEDFLGGDIPDSFREFPKAIIGRHVLSPNFELFRFLNLAGLTGLDPLCIEYLNDKFVARNIDKYYLCKSFFFDGIGRKGGYRLSALNIIDFAKAEGKKIKDLRTIWGGSLVDFHHRGVSIIDSEFKMESMDISVHSKIKGKSAEEYYPYYLALFVCFGVVFENYLLDSRQVDFTRNIVLPNFRKVEKIFGVRPLITPLVPIEDENEIFWKYYPAFLRNEMACVMA